MAIVTSAGKITLCMLRFNIFIYSFCFSISLIIFLISGKISKATREGGEKDQVPLQETQLQGQGLLRQIMYLFINSPTVVNIYY